MERRVVTDEQVKAIGLKTVRDEPSAAERRTIVTN
jgi:hypothetical protein